MHDIKNIRKNPDEFDEIMLHRGYYKPSETIIYAHDNVRFYEKLYNSSQVERKKWKELISENKKEGKDISEMIDWGKQLRDFATDEEKHLKHWQSILDELLLDLPNILDDDVPKGEPYIKYPFWGVDITNKQP